MKSILGCRLGLTLATVIFSTCLLVVSFAYAGDKALEEESKRQLETGCSAAGLPAELCNEAIDQVIRSARSYFTVHPMINADRSSGRDVFNMPLYFEPRQKSRISVNFEPFRGAKRAFPAKMFFKNVRPEDLRRVRASIMGDKHARNDQPRTASFGHNDIVPVSHANSKDRGFYVARLDFPGGREAFFLRNPEAILVITRDPEIKTRSSTVENNVDRRGHDYSNFALSSGAGHTACQRRCEADTGCFAWTFVKGKNPHCWLKSGVPQASANSCCTSGIIKLSK
jgi:PAN domain